MNDYNDICELITESGLSARVFCDTFNMEYDKIMDHAEAFMPAFYETHKAREHEKTTSEVLAEVKVDLENLMEPVDFFLKYPSLTIERLACYPEIRKEVSNYRSKYAPQLRFDQNILKEGLEINGKKVPKHTLFACYTVIQQCGMKSFPTELLVQLCFAKMNKKD